jgi:hypothetical protein
MSQTLPLGEMYSSQAFTFRLYDECCKMVKLIVILESQPDAFVITSEYVPELVQVLFPLGEVYETHAEGLIVELDE